MEELKFSRLFKSVGLKKAKFLCKEGEIIGVIIRKGEFRNIAHIDEYGKVIWKEEQNKGNDHVGIKTTL